MMDLFPLLSAQDCVPQMMPGATGLQLMLIRAELSALFYDAMPFQVFADRWAALGIGPGPVECVARIFLKPA